MADASEELSTLKEKYNRLKQANKVLKEGLLEKQESYSRLEEGLKEKDASLRQQLEEIDQLQFQNGRVSKQLGTVTAQLEEIKQKNQQGTGWSVGGLISGKQQQEAMQKATEEIRVLKEELIMKIQENEGLHMQLFEVNRMHGHDKDKLLDIEAKQQKEMDSISQQLTEAQSKAQGFHQAVQKSTAEVEQLQGQLVAANSFTNSLQETLETERAVARNQKSSLQAELLRWRPFDRARHELWNGLNACPSQGFALYERGQALTGLHAAATEACRQCSGLMRIWRRTFGGGSDEESATRLRVRTKMCGSVEELSKLLGELLPSLLVAIEAPISTPKTPGWAEDLKMHISEFVETHRKWVMYQSMLLLHDWNSSYAARSEQEEAQALRFVEWLWRLHWRLKAFLLRFGVIRHLRSLQISHSSAAHFALARQASAGSRCKDFSSELSPKAGCQQPPPQDKLKHALKTSPAGDYVACLLASLCKALREVTSCWEGIGRCLSAWAMQQASSGEGAFSQESGSVVELLEAVHRFTGYFTDRVLPALGKVEVSEDRSTGGPPVGPPDMLRFGPESFVAQEALNLSKAPPHIAFEQAVHTRQLSERLTETSAQLSTDLRQQVRRLQAVTSEKESLVEELRALQDNHALLQSNFESMQCRDGEAARGSETALASPPCPQQDTGLMTATRQTSSGNRADLHRGDGLVMSSRQRALLDSLSVTAQENSSLRQHGFFVEVLTLSTNDVSLASSAPPSTSTASFADRGSDVGVADASMQPYSSWELAVRRIYEQHARRLQADIRAAESKASELHLAVKDGLERLKVEQDSKQHFMDETSATKAKLQGLQDDMESTRKNYDNQLAMLTEHICGLSTKLSDKDANLAGFHARKVLCGRCGMWNHLGKLLATEEGGICQTCKERLLST